MEFDLLLEQKAKEIEQIINNYLPKEEGFQKTIFEAMNYSFLAGGKRLRPMIMLETYKAFGGLEGGIYPFMAALEMIHTYSLVHDDLPEMDNDELRRGKPTTHIAYGQAMAVLAGDGLLNYAFETVLNEGNSDNAYNVIKASQILGRKAGIYGMIGGQTVDVEAEKKNMILTEEQLLFTYENKTAALLQAAFMIGAVMAGADDATVAKLEKAGYALGIAFQLQDDILDITSTTEVLGKPVGSDERQGKVTYVSYLGLERAMEEQKRLSAEAAEIIDSFKESAKDKAAIEFIEELINWLVSRKL